MNMVYREPGRNEPHVPFMRPFRRSLEQAGYLESRRISASRGFNLPDYPLLDDYPPSESSNRMQPVWCRKIAVYPGPGKAFRKGKPVRDYTGWFYPSRYIPREALRRKGVALLVEPGKIEEGWGIVIIHPKSVELIENFPQSTGPTPVNTNLSAVPDMSGLPYRFWRLGRCGIRPLLRGIYGHWDNLSADYDPGAEFGLIGEIPF
jgi:hypothetical protein